MLPTLRLFAALFGCDYRQCKVRGIGPGIAIKLMQRHFLCQPRFVGPPRQNRGRWIFFAWTTASAS